MKIFICSLLGILFIVYGIAIQNVGTGVKMCFVWISMGVLLLVFAALLFFGLWQKLPAFVRWFTYCFVLLNVLVIFIVNILVFTDFSDDTDESLDYVIVLGAQVYENSPSRVLKYRLDKALSYLGTHPDTKCIVTGGQGWNEPLSEAQGMYNYLVQNGLDGSRIILEDRATDTSENIKFSMALMESRDASVGIISNNFHLFRAIKIAQKQGLTRIYGLAADSSLPYLPNNLLHEVCGVVKDFVLGNM